MDNAPVSFYSRRILTEQGMVEGVLEQECSELMSEFFRGLRGQRIK